VRAAGAARPESVVDAARSREHQIESQHHAGEEEPFHRVVKLSLKNVGELTL
jgi:hypothetical protein